MDVRLTVACPVCGTTRSALAYTALSDDEHCYLLSPCGHKVHAVDPGTASLCDCALSATRPTKPALMVAQKDVAKRA